MQMSFRVILVPIAAILFHLLLGTLTCLISSVILAPVVPEGRQPSSVATPTTLGVRLASSDRLGYSLY